MASQSSTSVHSVIILKGATVRYFCKDGLSSLSVLHVGELLNFGGNLVPVNCGVGNEWVAVVQARTDMNDLYMMYPKGSKEKFDAEKAMEENKAKSIKFEQSDLYKAWIA